MGGNVLPPQDPSVFSPPMASQAALGARICQVLIIGLSERVAS